MIFSTLTQLANFAQKRNLPEQQIAEMSSITLRQVAEQRFASGAHRSARVRSMQDKDSMLTRVLLDKILRDGDFSYVKLTGQEVTAYVERLASNGSSHPSTLDFDPGSSHSLGSSMGTSSRSNASTGILRLGKETVESAINLGDG